LYEERMARKGNETTRTYVAGRWGVVIAERAGEGLGSHVWEGALYMWRHLAAQGPLDFHHKRVIELGSGCGLVGIGIKTLAQSAHVVLTDRAPLLPLLRHNVRLNDLAEDPHFLVRELDWGENSTEFAEPFDYIVATDVVYDEKLFESLIKTILALSRNDTTLLLAYKKRDKSEGLFFDQISKYFTSTTLHRVRSKETKSDIIIFKMQRKRYSVIC